MNTRTEPQRPASFDLSAYGIEGPIVERNLSPAALYERALIHGDGARIADSGALIAYSGDKTGRSPKDKRVVRGESAQEGGEPGIWWGPVNIPISQRTFDINRSRAVDYLNTRARLYVVDAFAGWDPNHRLKVRVICERPYHALFMWTMLIRPTVEEVRGFGEPDWVIMNAGRFPANPLTAGMTSTTSVDLDFHGGDGTGEVVILGTEYAGEMKKGIFTVMNKLMPERGHLSMHCSATADPRTGASSLLFGLSGTGKTTLSADPERRLVGDDEHVWTGEGIFNIEGGCYAKAIHLSKENEPQIFEALKFGAVLENVRLDEADHHVDFDDTSITQNTRGAYPLEHVPNAELPAVAGHPTDVIFLTADAFGVLPPVSRLTPEQAMVHFISGYTAKVAGTEQGVDKPEATFSPCFGGPFLVWHPARYAELLAEKIREHDAKVWLVNTGWTGGACGEGERIALKHTRGIIDAIHRGLLGEAATEEDPVFGLHVVTEIPGVPSEVLSPRGTWKDPSAYDAAASELAGRFRENFKKYEDGVDDAVKAAVPGG
ncbi:phosphoenolpyruvate carboxykinase (ATP) [Phycisphaera mikurensis]|uniref:Phosphoenolpyruvate carboxykinase (ATP) n=1 Tax=Phycisphaera mikurensis (strain NBRC 102666 / KCTC 22515 / FYK2301M01) TaxID=1142394 RepID=I0IHQ8_PHYMF|nr:phosphoenolpyruvate carboxykinase (ATP) [Phycisphaera mikurensis]MBB6441040.1 phosphoenolpyruvate carboxykinase (ATP) [Phycisphaera mikurensis]BAM04796.1 phosphoenolpyruvate carboxykinase [ATP] [Phycisphaera mikurensis NBRC 102666]